jgi:NADPH-dependent curcumin reductase CurA
MHVKKLLELLFPKEQQIKSHHNHPLIGSYSRRDFMASTEGLVELPPDLSYENATAIALGYFTAFAGIVRTGVVKSGETVLVTGTTGSVGSAAASARDFVARQMMICWHSSRLKWRAANSWRLFKLP